jgi:hypothetical protein
MIEVFKTDVDCPSHAGVLLDIIHDTFPHYRANFDLQDCDRILRVASSAGPVHTEGLVHLLDSYGYCAAPLPDEVPPPPLDRLVSTELTPLGYFSGNTKDPNRKEHGS